MADKKINGSVEITGKLNPNSSGYGLTLPDTTGLTTDQQIATVEAVNRNISDEYDSTNTYHEGDLVIYDNVLYKCNTSPTTGNWDSSKWNQTTVDAEKGTKLYRHILYSGDDPLHTVQHIIVISCIPHSYTIDNFDDAFDICIDPTTIKMQTEEGYTLIPDMENKYFSYITINGDQIDFAPIDDFTWEGHTELIKEIKIPYYYN